MSIYTHDEQHNKEKLRVARSNEFMLITIDFSSLAIANRSQDLLQSIRAAARVKDDSVIVDLLGAILEKK